MCTNAPGSGMLGKPGTPACQSLPPAHPETADPIGQAQVIEASGGELGKEGNVHLPGLIVSQAPATGEAETIPLQPPPAAGKGRWTGHCTPTAPQHGGGTISDKPQAARASLLPQFCLSRLFPEPQKQGRPRTQTRIRCFGRTSLNRTAQCLMPPIPRLPGPQVEEGHV